MNITEQKEDTKKYGEPSSYRHQEHHKASTNSTTTTSISGCLTSTTQEEFTSNSSARRNNKNTKNEEGEEEVLLVEDNYMKQAERKRSREKKRRQDISDAMEKLTEVLLKVDSSNLVQYNNQVYFGNWSRTSESSNHGYPPYIGVPGTIPVRHKNPLNRTEIINHTTHMIRKLARQNEEYKLMKLQLEYNLSGAQHQGIYLNSTTIPAPQHTNVPPPSIPPLFQYQHVVSSANDIFCYFFLFEEIHSEISQ